MKSFLNSIPIPLSGLALALVATGNLIRIYGEFPRYVFGLLGGCILLLMTTKYILTPDSLKEGLNAPVPASVVPTYFMALMLFTTYLVPYFPTLALVLWFFAVLGHFIWLFIFSKKYILGLRIEQVFPSYFIVLVGIVCASVSSGAHGLNGLGRYIFWFGFISFLIFLPIVLYRVIVYKQIPDSAKPTFTILTAPASLCLTGYFKAFEIKSPGLIAFLGVLSILMFIVVLTQFPQMLRLKFYPSYSAFTFPLVITAIGMRETYNYLLSLTLLDIPSWNLSLFYLFCKLLEGMAVLMVLYVLMRYILFLYVHNTRKRNTPNVTLSPF